MFIIGTLHQPRRLGKAKEGSSHATAGIATGAGAWARKSGKPRQKRLRAEGRFEGQSLREPITPSLCKLASLIALGTLSVSLAWPQTSQPVAKEDQSPAEAAANSLGALAKYQGQIVRNIEFRGIAGANPEMLRKLLAQQTGDPLDRD